MIQLKRIYEPKARSDGRRFFVERLWPRGIKKEELSDKAWLKEVAPSAELRDEQLDSDSIPPYDLLDPVLEAYVEEDRSREELVEEFDPAVVERAVGLVDRAEYKRRQAPPGVKLRPKAFGRDRRTPITNRWRG